MQSPVYFSSWVVGVCILWFFWSFGIRRLFLDLFRERLFELRFDLFRLGMDGRLPYDSETYRFLETLACGMLRFGHRITFLTYVLGRLEQERAKREKDFVDIGDQIALKVSRLDPETQKEVAQIVDGIRTATIVYMAFSSLFFLLIFAVFFLAKILRVWRPDEKAKEMSFVIEREAYRAESMRSLRPAAA